MHKLISLTLNKVQKLWIGGLELTWEWLFTFKIPLEVHDTASKMLVATAPNSNARSHQEAKQSIHRAECRVGGGNSSGQKAHAQAERLSLITFLRSNDARLTDSQFSHVLFLFRIRRQIVRNLSLVKQSFQLSITNFSLKIIITSNMSSSYVNIRDSFLI